MTRKRLLNWLRDLALLALLFLGVQWWLARDLPEGLAPALVGRDLSGRTVTLAEYRGRPVLVHFWATWCPICRLEDDSIDAIARDHAVLTVATTSGDAKELRAYLEREGLAFRVVLDEDGDLARAWRVAGVPASFVLDGEGSIRWARTGYTPGLELRLRLWWAGRGRS